MIDRKKASAKGSSIANTGDNVNITLNQFSDGPKRSIIFNICQAISDSNIEYDEEYSIKTNADWMRKFSFNNVVTYQEIFEDYASGYDKIEEILCDFPKREMTIRKIHACYVKIVQNYDINNIDGDSVLEDVFNELKSLVANVNGYELHCRCWERSRKRKWCWKNNTFKTNRFMLGGTKQKVYIYRF